MTYTIKLGESKETHCTYKRNLFRTIYILFKTLFFSFFFSSRRCLSRLDDLLRGSLRVLIGRESRQNGLGRGAADVLVVETPGRRTNCAQAVNVSVMELGAIFAVFKRERSD